MDTNDIGKSIRIKMKDGFAKTGFLKTVNGERSITIHYHNGDDEEIFLDTVSSIRVNNNGFIYGRE